MYINANNGKLSIELFVRTHESINVCRSHSYTKIFQYLIRMRKLELHPPRCVTVLLRICCAFNDLCRGAQSKTGADQSESRTPRSKTRRKGADRVRWNNICATTDSLIWHVVGAGACCCSIGKRDQTRTAREIEGGMPISQTTVSENND